MLPTAGVPGTLGGQGAGRGPPGAGLQLRPRCRRAHMQPGREGAAAGASARSPAGARVTLLMKQKILESNC